MVIWGEKMMARDCTGRYLSLLAFLGLFFVSLAGMAQGAGWDKYAGGRLSVENRHNLAVYERRSQRFRMVRLPSDLEILNAGWDNVRLVINCLAPYGDSVRYVFLTPERFHVERR